MVMAAAGRAATTEDRAGKVVRLLPRDSKFYGYFRDAAANAGEVAAALSDLLTDYRDVPQKVRRIEDLEHRGDEITHRIIDDLNNTFLTPLDREDVAELTNKLDDFIDNITAAAERLLLYQVDQPTEQAQLLGRILAEQGMAAAEAIALLGNDQERSAILRLTREMNRLEDEADDVLSMALAELFDGVDDIPLVIKAIHWGELYQRLEDATDRGEDLANTLEAIVLK